MQVSYSRGPNITGYRAVKIRLGNTTPTFFTDSTCSEVVNYQSMHVPRSDFDFSADRTASPRRPAGSERSYAEGTCV